MIPVGRAVAADGPGEEKKDRIDDRLIPEHRLAVDAILDRTNDALLFRRRGSFQLRSRGKVEYRNL